MDTINDTSELFLSWMEELTEVNPVDIYEKLVTFALIDGNKVPFELFKRIYSNIFKSLDDNRLQNQTSKRSFGEKLLSNLHNS